MRLFAIIITFLALGWIGCAVAPIQRTLVMTSLDDGELEEGGAEGGPEGRPVEREPSWAAGGVDSEVAVAERQVRRIDLPTPETPDEGAGAEMTTDEVFLSPVEEISVSSPFGVRRDPIRRSRRRMHRGVDLRGERGTPVYATASGRALMAGWCDGGTGNCVVLEHRHGWRSQYFHMSRVHIRAGQWVEQGTHIGDIGSTGRSTGPHLHFQLGRNGQAVDPMPLIGAPLTQPPPTLD